MSYASQANRPNPLAVFGALGVPAGVGAILIAGLAVKIVIEPPVPNPSATDIPDVVVTPNPVETKAPPTNERNTANETPTPRPIPAPEVNLTGDETLTFPSGLNENWGGGLEPIEVNIPQPRPSASFDPVDATPRGNPANWITTADYRSSWIRRELTGTARFTLQVDTSGRVSDCQVTGSTGYAVLDRATCRLISARAVFNPAKGSDGKPTAGRYSSVVAWQIPQ